MAGASAGGRGWLERVARGPTFICCALRTWKVKVLPLLSSHLVSPPKFSSAWNYSSLPFLLRIKLSRNLEDIISSQRLLFSVRVFFVHPVRKSQGRLLPSSSGQVQRDLDLTQTFSLQTAQVIKPVKEAIANR